MKIDTTTEVLTRTGGIALAGKVFKEIGLDFTSDAILSRADKQIIKTMTGLFLQGRNSFEEVNMVRNCSFFSKALGLQYVYARETLRLYMERIAENVKEHTLKALDAVNLNLLKREHYTTIKTETAQYVPVDIDVSPMDNSRTKKEGVSRTYKGMDGYSPIFSYIGKEGYMLDCELRPGKQHCQKNTPEYLEKELKIIKELALNVPVLLRLDSGNDATLKPLMKSGHFYLVKRNLRRESPEKWVDIGRAMGDLSVPRKGKEVYTGVFCGSHPQAEEEEENLPDIDQVFRVTLRHSDHEGNQFLFPEVDVEVYWTNLYESPETVIQLYHDRGNSEQFHSELKSDMAFERFPSGKMDVNAILLPIAMIAFNTLRRIGQIAMSYKERLPYTHKGTRKRLRKVIDDLICIPGKFVCHANQWILRLWEHDPWYPIFREIFLSL